MGAPDRRRAGLREPEIADLAGPDEVSDRSRDLLDRHGRIDAVLVEQVDAIRPQAPQRGFRDGADRRGPAVEPDIFGAVLEAELGGHDHVVTERRDGLADHCLIGERPISLGRVEQCHAAVEGRADEADRLGG